jgi:hypothetical protein
MSGARVFGRMCRAISRRSRAPSARAATTNSRARSSRKPARVSRANGRHERDADGDHADHDAGANTAANRSAERIAGKPWIASTSRMNASSIQPPT